MDEKREKKTGRYKEKIAEGIKKEWEWETAIVIYLYVGMSNAFISWYKRNEIASNSMEENLRIKVIAKLLNE